MYRMNDGVAFLYTVLDDESEGGKPLKPVKGTGKVFFEYIGISAEDFNIAMQEETKLDVRIRILQNKKISTQDVVRIEDQYYKIWRVRHSVNKSNVPITDITLVATPQKYGVRK